MNGISQSFYSKIASEIMGQIRDGLYNPGEKLFSRKQLCDKYRVSDTTACRVQNEMVRLGCAYKIKGKGMFVASLSEREKAPVAESEVFQLERIVCFNYNDQRTRSQWHVPRIFHGVQQRAFELGINMRNEFINIDSSKSFNLKEDEVAIVISGGGRNYLSPLFANPRAKAVFIDNLFPEVYCVLTDNYSGMVQILDFLESRDCRKVILATKFFGSLGLANLSERTYAFENECKRRGLDYQILKSGNYKELLKISKLTDAVVFTSDEPALKFKKILKESDLKKVPLITGFDDWIEGKGKETEGLTTINVNFEQMGATAVDVVLENKLEDWCMPEMVRVPCELVVRD